MNTYAKSSYPNVFLAKCSEPQEKDSTIIVETKYGKEHECIVFNLIYEKEGFYYYSVVRADGFNVQEWAKQRAEKLQRAALNANKKSSQYWEASKEGKDFLVLAEPIKVGHHSEKRHRALIERNQKRMSKCVEFSDKAEEYSERSDYWEKRAETINLSMPESLIFYQYKLQHAKQLHKGLKDGTIQRSHSFSLAYANKDVKRFESLYEAAKKLWE